MFRTHQAAHLASASAATRRLRLAALLVLLLLAALFAPLASYAQRQSKKAVQRRVQALFPDSLTQAEVLLVGVFHFNYPGLDAHKTDNRIQVDVLSAERQQQLAELSRQLARFRPTKIVVEYPAEEQAALDKAYADFTPEKLKTKRNEITQVGFRLARQLQHPRVYAVDADPFRFRLAPKDSVWMSKYDEQALAPAQQRLRNRYQAYYKFMDTLAYRSTLQEQLLFMNSDDALRRSHSAYFVYTPLGTNAEPAGADGFITRWFNRNLRMFAAVQRLVAPQDRILVLVGAGHVPILKHLVENAPELKLRRLDEFVR